MRGEPVLSVVVPTLDEELKIEDCLASVGTRTDVEIVISDGGSSDATLSIVQSDRPDAVVVSGSRGRGGQLNRGAETARGDRLLFLHADCVLPNGW